MIFLRAGTGLILLHPVPGNPGLRRGPSELEAPFEDRGRSSHVQESLLLFTVLPAHPPSAQQLSSSAHGDGPFAHSGLSGCLAPHPTVHDSFLSWKYSCVHLILTLFACRSPGGTHTHTHTPARGPSSVLLQARSSHLCASHSRVALVPVPQGSTPTPTLARSQPSHPTSAPCPASRRARAPSRTTTF